MHADSHSPKIRLEAFAPAHAAALRLPAPLRRRLDALGGAERLVRGYLGAGPAWTLMAGDQPVACGGAVRFWPGVGELWCWTGENARLWAVPFARHARSEVETLFNKAGGFHRLQAHVREDDPRAAAFARFLGLSLEGRCPGYGPDQSTHLLYGRYLAWKE